MAAILASDYPINKKLNSFNTLALDLQADAGDSGEGDHDDIVATAMASPQQPPRDSNNAAARSLRTRSEVQRRRSYSPYAPGGLFARRPDPSPQVCNYSLLSSSLPSNVFCPLQLPDSSGSALMLLA